GEESAGVALARAGAEAVQDIDRKILVPVVGADRAGLVGLTRQLGLARGAIAGAAIAVRAEAELLALDLDRIFAPRFNQGQECRRRALRCRRLAARAACRVDCGLRIRLHRL